MSDGALGDIRVVEMGQLLAGPFCGQLLGDFGAEVIKIEPPGRGDPMRDWGREKPHGKSLWWPILARNKKSVTLNLRDQRGQEIARKLIATADVLVENFRPGTLERWGLAPGRPVARQPRADHHQGHRLRPVRAVRRPGRVRLDRRGDGRHPVRNGRSRQAAIADGDLPRRRARRYLRRARNAGSPACPAADRPRSDRRCRAVRGRARADGVPAPGVGSRRLPARADRIGAAQRGAEQRLPDRDGPVLIAANQDSVFRRLATVMGQPELADDERYATHGARGANSERAG